MRSVLLLAHRFPPLGGAAVQRNVQLARYLAGAGYRPIVVTGPGAHDDPRWMPRDAALVDRRLPCDRSPGDRETSRSSRRRALRRWLRVPSPWERWWSAAALETALAVGADVDLLHVSLAPFSAADAALALARKLDKPLVIDLEDPWALDDMQSYTSGLHRRLERPRDAPGSSRGRHDRDEYARSAAAGTAGVPRTGSDRVAAIPNAFDPLDFAAPAPEPPARRSLSHRSYRHVAHRSGPEAAEPGAAACAGSSAALMQGVDFRQALDWLLRQGVDFDGMRVMGLDDLLGAAPRARCASATATFNLDDALDEMRRKLDEILELERDALEEVARRRRTLAAKRPSSTTCRARLSEAIERLARATASRTPRPRADVREPARRARRTSARSRSSSAATATLPGPRVARLRARARADARDGAAEAARGGAARAATSAAIDLERPRATRSATRRRRTSQNLRQIMRLLARTRATSRSARAGTRSSRRRACARSDSWRCATSTRASCATGRRPRRPTSAARPSCGRRRRKPYAYGDPLAPRPGRARSSRRCAREPGTPLELAPDDFEVHDADARHHAPRPCCSST